MESGEWSGRGDDAGARPKKASGILRTDGSPLRDRPGAHRRKSSTASADYRFASLNPNVSLFKSLFHRLVLQDATRKVSLSVPSL